MTVQVEPWPGPRQMAFSLYKAKQARWRISNYFKKQIESWHRYCSLLKYFVCPTLLESYAFFFKCSTQCSDFLICDTPRSSQRLGLEPGLVHFSFEVPDVPHRFQVHSTHTAERRLVPGKVDESAKDGRSKSSKS